MPSGCEFYLYLSSRWCNSTVRRK